MPTTSSPSGRPFIPVLLLAFASVAATAGTDGRSVSRVPPPAAAGFPARDAGALPGVPGLALPGAPADSTAPDPLQPATVFS